MTASARPVRALGGSDRVTALVVIATVTIVVVRTYLALTGYPQIGGHSNLHIAHALFGGGLMILALVLGCLFVGSRARWIEIVVGGVGIGLFLDEVGKFVTKTNDYFYHPAAEIMYLTILIVVIGGNLVQAVHRTTVRERLVDVGIGAAEGMAFGLTRERLRNLSASLDAIEAAGVDPIEVAALRSALSRCDVHDGRAAALGRRVRSMLPRWVVSRRLAAAAGWLMAITALQVALSSLGGFGIRPSQLLFEAGGGDTVEVMSDRVYIVLGSVTFVCSVVALVRWRRGGTPQVRVQALRLLHATAIAFTVVGGVVDFAEFGGFALVSIVVGVTTILLLRAQIAIESTVVEADVTQ
ncbi:hypothetical protein [Gordonia phthalatica]|uniref:Uncharacterized protein n=1 Tax=Gordonia phthalatica TaxID=1136941 RepID=A0A0N9N9I3_9ACTN|nr:hypothetical protein [Gordonia phthalatica]ALG84067.1 hypothetical protein ACH46_05560 [Gordonia phthalatica]